MARYLVTVLLLFAATAIAQTHREQITVNLVEVPVYLDSLTGRPITGLTKEDFELFVNGARHPIQTFDVLDERAPATVVPSEAAAAPLAHRRLVVLLFDVGGTTRFGRIFAQRMAAKFVDTAAPGTTFAVATIGSSGIRFLVPFTTDRPAVQKAVQTLSRRSGDPLHLATIDAGKAVGGFGSSMAASAGDRANPVQDEIDVIEQASMIEQLAALADRLAALTGRKEVILLSEGSRSGSNQLRFELSVRQRLMNMHQRFRAAGVLLHAVDAAGLRAPFPGSAEQRGNTTALLSAPKALYSLALGTGGAVKSSLRALQNVQRVTYVLGFQPRGPQKERNTIRVRVKNLPLGTIVRYRPGYSAEGPYGSGSGDVLVLADTLMNDIAQEGITVGLEVTKKSATTELAAVMPGPELLALSGDGPVLLDVFFYLFDDRHLVADWHYARIAIDREKGREFLSANPFTVRKEFAGLQPGCYAAKTLVRVVGTDVTGFRRAEVEIPLNGMIVPSAAR
ncbi:MAG: VWA domain-containing protein [Acidobacteriota bacterium]